MEEDGQAEGRLQVVREDGVKIPVLLRGVAVRGADGRTIGRVQTARIVGTPPPLGPLLGAPLGRTLAEP